MDLGEMNDDSDNVKRLPIRFKTAPAEDRTFVFPYEVAKGPQCFHSRFVIDEAKAEVECATCGERLNPMWVLKHLAGKDNRFHEARKRYADEMARLSERERTKCEHCEKMTRISRR